jgi:hypothetical protein
METKTFTIAAKSKPSETTSPVVASAEEPAGPRYGIVIIIIGIVVLAAAGLAVYKINTKS